jgi:hypothetical protein
MIDLKKIETILSNARSKTDFLEREQIENDLFKEKLQFEIEKATRPRLSKGHAGWKAIK